MKTEHKADQDECCESSSELRRLREYHLERLNQAVRRPSMYGGEVALRIYMNNVAFQDGLEGVWIQEQNNLVTRGASVSTGVAGAFARVMPAYTNDAAVASVYADIAWRYGWLVVDRSVSDEEYDQLGSESGRWRNRDYRLADIEAEFGAPSVCFGGGNYRFPHTVAYAPSSCDRGLICLHFASACSGALGSGTDLESPMLLAVRCGTGPFAESFTFSPVGSHLAVSRSSG